MVGTGRLCTYQRAEESVCFLHAINSQITTEAPHAISCLPLPKKAAAKTITKDSLSLTTFVILETWQDLELRRKHTLESVYECTHRED